eukprot:TRINITY_DN2875_c0_g1_i1.p1 TRINITY_DN2875_c0_g1~~TRINITY_DN2875_c0_g1_i1.p1  ORF type:complete len:286 (+),score=99.45 TRINITY_DN2875_c0_g1_i1:98-859(+)
MASENYTERFAVVARKTIDEQTKFFLREFVLDFKGNFEQVLDIAEDFRKWAPKDQQQTCGSIEEFQAHRFLESRDETLTVKALRDYLSQVELGAHHPVAVIEYFLYKFQKSAAELFAPKPEGAISPEILAALEAAIDAYQKSLREQREREEEMKRLEVTASGKRSVASVQAGNKKNDLAGQEFAQKFAELKALKAKKEAQKAVDEAPKVDIRQKQLEEEQARLAAEKKKKAEEEAAARAASKARLAAKAKLWN